ncbi:lanthionine synthetase C family protein [Spongiactinospora gelatinilytica]|uniref:lanthionine synthetase C family protein n=1 Tax=Spongiactinospora gelatinilytica TaxID=2666298 RepID=UPI00131465A3|nr:lanthionine synthetase C family protein [Spongiactinospora gelatinilytica]
MTSTAPAAQLSAASGAAEQIADRLAEELAVPPRLDDRLPGWWPQSLAHGGVGIALLHIERAASGRASWGPAQHWLRFVTSGELSIGTNAGLYFGAPAVEFMVHAAAPHLHGLAEHNLPTLQEATDRVIGHRLEAARHRLNVRRRPTLAEFDGIRGLAGLSAVLLCRADPATGPLDQALAHLVAVTEPLMDDPDLLPGWWSDMAPDGTLSVEFTGGHANTGMAHGIAGVLAVLAMALQRGFAVTGQATAIARILAWLDRWQQQGPAGPWWPYWITRPMLRTSGPIERRPQRPSWCYGTLGVARAQQLAAMALGDPHRRAHAEGAAAVALSDPHQLRLINDSSLCHGYAGVIHIAGLMATDSPTPRTLASTIAPLLEPLTRHLTNQQDPGWMEGKAGIALALHALAVRPRTGWDRALLIA